MFVRNLETVDFRTLQIFANTCKHMSVTHCADDMGLPKSTVSKAISKLEEHLETPLLERSTRRILITEAGQMVRERAEFLLEELKTLSQDVQELEQHVQGSIRLSVPTMMGSYIAQEIFPNFLKKWPKVHISLELSNEYVDLFTSGIDMAIRVGQVNDDRLIAREIGTSTKVLVASPEYLKSHGVPDSPEDLIKHNGISCFYMEEGMTWNLVSEQQTQQVEVSSNFSCSSLEAIKQATRQGIGIAQLPLNTVLCDLRNESLVRVLPDWNSGLLPIYLVYRPLRSKPKRMRTFIDYIQGEKDKFDLTTPQCRFN